MRGPNLSAAILVAASLGGGQARAVEAPKRPITPGAVPCPSKGPGFVRLPGGDGCIRVSGRVVAGAGLHGAAAPAVTGRLAIDNRADTDLGEVRTFVRIGNGRR